jgi:hypothetical protein
MEMVGSEDTGLRSRVTGLVHSDKRGGVGPRWMDWAFRWEYCSIAGASGAFCDSGQVVELKRFSQFLLVLVLVHQRLLKRLFVRRPALE